MRLTFIEDAFILRPNAMKDDINNTVFKLYLLTIGEQFKDISLKIFS
jgi:hypothetical protein